MESYATNLAYIHDQGFGGLARAGATALLAELKAAGIHSGRIVELGCGSGITASLLASSGYQVDGYDISSAMLAIARRRAPTATFHEAPLMQATIPPCRAVIAFGEVLNYQFAGQSSMDDWAALFQRIYVALEPGGLWMFDGAEPRRASSPTRGFTQGPDWVCLYEASEDEAHQSLSRSIITFRKRGEGYERHDETHRLRLFDRKAICRALEVAGFRVRILNGYADLPFTTGHVGFLAQK